MKAKLGLKNYGWDVKVYLDEVEVEAELGNIMSFHEFWEPNESQIRLISLIFMNQNKISRKL